MRIPIAMRCRERICQSKHEETYCMRPAGHEGEHSVFWPMTHAEISDLRCTARNEKGNWCGQPAGHAGMHSTDKEEEL